ncbi:hypothetical protein Hanom_Chr16g01442231 [Helianthus anomalus]
MRLQHITTYVPTPVEKDKLKKKGIRKRKTRPTRDLPRRVKSRKDTTSIPQRDPEFERVEDVEVEITGVRKSTPPPSPINKTIHISPDQEKTLEQPPKTVEEPTSATKKP